MATLTETRQAKRAFLPHLGAWGLPITWFELTGIHGLDDERRAVLTLVIGNTQGHYTGINVAIVSKTAGPITEKCFRFNDYLHARPRDLPTIHEGLLVIDHCGWKWYIEEPISTQPLIDAIELYIALWR